MPESGGPKGQVVWKRSKKAMRGVMPSNVSTADQFKDKTRIHFEAVEKKLLSVELTTFLSNVNTFLSMYRYDKRLSMLT